MQQTSCKQPLQEEGKDESACGKTERALPRDSLALQNKGRRMRTVNKDRDSLTCMDLSGGFLVPLGCADKTDTLHLVRTGYLKRVVSRNTPKCAEGRMGVPLKSEDGCFDSNELGVFAPDLLPSGEGQKCGDNRTHISEAKRVDEDTKFHQKSTLVLDGTGIDDPKQEHQGFPAQQMAICIPTFSSSRRI